VEKRQAHPVKSNHPRARLTVVNLNHHEIEYAVTALKFVAKEEGRVIKVLVVVSWGGL
jgi:hypothetical protein